MSDYKNPVLEACDIVLVLAGKIANGMNGSLEELRNYVIQSIDVAETRLFEANLSTEQVLHAKYALCALIDELVMTSGREDRHNWMVQPLQSTQFGEHMAGEGFFERLATLRQNPDQYMDLVELYYVCMHLGFKGKYRKLGDERHMALMVDLRSQIEMHRGQAPREFSASARPTGGLLGTFRSDKSPWLMPLAAAALVMLMLVGVNLYVDRLDDRYRAQIQAGHGASVITDTGETGSMI